MDINAGTLYAQVVLGGRFVTSASWEHKAENDKTFYFSEDELLANASIEGQCFTGNPTQDNPAALEAIASIGGTMIIGSVSYGLMEAIAEISAYYDITYPKRHWVGWSKIGEARIVVDESNESGYKPLPGSQTGIVYKVLSLQEKFPILYSTAGVFQMIPVREPFATFGFKELFNKGILGPGCACGDEKQHYFITKDYDLWSLSGDGQPKRLGYSDFIKTLSPAGEMILMHYDKEDMRAYISSPVDGLTLTTEGLGGGFQNITGISGQYFASPVAVVVPTQEICTDILDMQVRGLKTIQTVAVGTDAAEDLYVAVDYRYDKKSSFTTSAWFPCNKEGVAFPIVSGVEFRIRVKNLVHDLVDIDYLNIRFKYVDKRFHRGYIPQNTVGSD